MASSQVRGTWDTDDGGAATRFPRQGLHSPAKSVQFYYLYFSWFGQFQLSNLVFAPPYSTLWRRMTSTFLRSL